MPGPGLGEAGRSVWLTARVRARSGMASRLDTLSPVMGLRKVAGCGGTRLDSDRSTTMTTPGPDKKADLTLTSAKPRQGFRVCSVFPGDSWEGACKPRGWPPAQGPSPRTRSPAQGKSASGRFSALHPLLFPTGAGDVSTFPKLQGGPSSGSRCQASNEPRDAKRQEINQNLPLTFNRALGGACSLSWITTEAGNVMCY